MERFCKKCLEQLDLIREKLGYPFLSHAISNKVLCVKCLSIAKKHLDVETERYLGEVPKVSGVIMGVLYNNLADDKEKVEMLKRLL